MKKALGWEPKVPLREGLARMVDDFTKRWGAPTECNAVSCKPAGMLCCLVRVCLHCILDMHH